MNKIAEYAALIVEDTATSANNLAAFMGAPQNSENIVR